MDDLTGKLSEILSDPEGMRRVQELAGMLGLQTAEKPSEDPVQADVLGAAARLMPLVSRFRQEDDTTRLLQALRPLLSEDRRPRLDRALQLIRMLRLLPLLRESGLPFFL